MFRRLISSSLTKLSSNRLLFREQPQRYFRITTARPDLMEFFDDPKNWGEQEIKVGRSWKVDELRLKSNTDLHKLWYILLKERNMLFTMEHDAKVEFRLFPNPERIDKVQDSMANIETVVRERNRAYFLLETGHTGERPGAEVENFLGLKEYVQHDEYHVPKEQNKEYLLRKEAEPKSSSREKHWFLVRWRAKQRTLARKELRRKQYEVLSILRNFPDCDKEALQEKYPDVNIPRYVALFSVAIFIMVTAWYIDDNENPGDDVLVDEIYTKTGILYYRLNMDSFDTDGRIQEIRKERKYGYQDILDINPERLPNYEARVKGFHTEHQHPEEEIRMVIKGITFFDVRDKGDRWMRLRMTPGDLVVLPPMIFHRLTLIEEDPDVVIYRLFKESPIWTAFNRHSEITAE